MGKNKELRARYIPLTTNSISQIPLVGMFENEFRTWCFEPGIVVLLGYVWMYARKIESFERGRRENGFKRKIEFRDVSLM